MSLLPFQTVIIVPKVVVMALRCYTCSVQYLFEMPLQFQSIFLCFAKFWRTPVLLAICLLTCSSHVLHLPFTTFGLYFLAVQAKDTWWSMQAPKLNGLLFCSLRLRAHCLKRKDARAKATAMLDAYVVKCKRCTRKKLIERSFRLDMANELPNNWEEIAIPRTQISNISVDASKPPYSPDGEALADLEPDIIVLREQTTSKWREYLRANQISKLAKRNKAYSVNSDLFFFDWHRYLFVL